MTILAQQSGPPFPVVGLFFVGLVLLVIFSLFWTISANRRRLELFQRLARDYSGTVDSTGVFEFPRLRFQHGGTQALLKFSSHSDGENRYFKTHFSIYLPPRTLRCDIQPTGVLASMQRFLGMQDIQIGSRQFDDAFVITGNDEEAIRTLLSPAVQATLFALARQFHTTLFTSLDLHCQISAGILTITKRALIEDQTSLRAFLELGKRLYDEVLTTRMAGIEFVESSAPPLGDESPHCTVCGEPLGGDIIFCRRCRTAHHRECWQYFGGCSTYACGEKRFLERKKTT